MPQDNFTKYLPKSQWKKAPTLREPLTDDRYVKFDVGYYAPPTPEMWIEAKEDFTPPATWAEYARMDKSRLDKFFLDTWGPEYTEQGTDDRMGRADAPVPITSQLFMAKSICRKIREGSLDKRSVLLWVNFPRIAPCWYLMGARQSYWLMSEEELGFNHG